MEKEKSYQQSTVGWMVDPNKISIFANPFREKAKDDISDKTITTKKHLQ